MYWLHLNNCLISLKALLMRIANDFALLLFNVSWEQLWFRQSQNYNTSILNWILL